MNASARVEPVLPRTDAAGVPRGSPVRVDPEAIAEPFRFGEVVEI